MSPTTPQLKMRKKEENMGPCAQESREHHHDPRMEEPDARWLPRAQANLMELKSGVRNRIKLDLHTTASAVGTSDVQMGKLSNQRKQKPGRRRDERGKDACS